MAKKDFIEKENDEMSECMIKGCSMDAYRNGFCREHYLQMRSYNGFGNHNGSNGSSVNTSARFHFQAMLLHTEKMLGKTVSFYNKWTTVGVDDAVEIYWKNARSYYSSGQYDRAAFALEKLIELNPGNADAHYWLGVVSEKMSTYERAMYAYEDALELQPDHVDARYRLGLIHSRRNNYDTATECFEKVIKLSPEHFEGYYRLGLAHDNRGEQDKAIESLQKAIDVNPGFARAYQSLGLVYDGMGMHEKAIGFLKKAIELQDSWE